MRAIHNCDSPHNVGVVDVSNMSKIRYESNSQPLTMMVRRRIWCFQYVKDTIWEQFTTCDLRDAEVLTGSFVIIVPAGRYNEHYHGCFVDHVTEPVLLVYPARPHATASFENLRFPRSGVRVFLQFSEEFLQLSVCGSVTLPQPHCVFNGFFAPVYLIHGSTRSKKLSSSSPGCIVWTRPALMSSMPLLMDSSSARDKSSSAGEMHMGLAWGRVTKTGSFSASSK